MFSKDTRESLLASDLSSISGFPRFNRSESFSKRARTKKGMRAQWIHPELCIYIHATEEVQSKEKKVSKRFAMVYPVDSERSQRDLLLYVVFLVPPGLEPYLHPGYLLYHTPINSDFHGISCASARVTYIAANQTLVPFFREGLAPQCTKNIEQRTHRYITIHRIATGRVSYSIVAKVFAGDSSVTRVFQRVIEKHARISRWYFRPCLPDTSPRFVCFADFTRTTVTDLT